MVKTIVKRDGRVIPYTREKITIAIQKAQQSCVQKDGSEVIAGEAEKIALKVEELLNRTGKSEFDIEEVQDAVVETLIHCDNAKQPRHTFYTGMNEIVPEALKQD